MCKKDKGNFLSAFDKIYILDKKDTKIVDRFFEKIEKEIEENK